MTDRGKTILAILDRAFPDGRGGAATDPVILLEDGSAMTFEVQETDVARYGVAIVRHDALSEFARAARKTRGR